MKKFSILSALVIALLSFGTAFAELEWEDPALCVNGKWLTIVAANPSAVKIVVPQGTAYGDQAAGRCTTPAPAPLVPVSAVTQKGGGHKFTVVVNGSQATSTVVVSYGAQSETRVNHGGEMRFRFDLGGSSR